MFISSKFYTGLPVLILTGCLLAGCGAKQKTDTASDSASAVSAQSSESISSSEANTESSSEDDLSDLIPEMQTVVLAIKQATKYETFHIIMNAEMVLDSSLVSGTYDFTSEMDVDQDLSDPDSLNASIISTSSMDDVVTTVTYSDGMYHCVKQGTDINEDILEEKEPEVIWETVNEVTDLVENSASEITEVTITREGENTCYTYELLPMMAQNYITELKDNAKVEQLEGTSVSVESATLTTVLNPDGELVRQDADMTGKLKKAVFAVPVHVVLSAEYTHE